jgi:hypothetical protein
MASQTFPQVSALALYLYSVYALFISAYQHIPIFILYSLIHISISAHTCRWYILPQSVYSKEYSCVVKNICMFIQIITYL